MAFYKNPSAIKRSILAFVRHLLSKSLYRAFELLLSPCCPPVITNATAVCNGDSTFTFSNVPNYIEDDTVPVAIEMFLPTNTTETIGVTLYSNVFSLYFPLCP
mgnify:CR=1 FL=1